ncbi:FMN-binding protein [Virgisporangium aurantiacum]|uniref:FMN-binding protein n=1 Tax=Virgisporangium aurantiacum TaxID=175570 RepID=A0A8J3ZC03_9ACTN|nr:FMN-binding protein [Virgisporangium aurantiacum]GIJ61082.1 FMN-binding protein [Virgisporangium aurantiacum]
MRRITWWLLSTVAALALLFSYRTSTMGAGPAVAAAEETADPVAAATTGAQGAVYKGSVAQTRWGAVQVTITVIDGKITSVAVPQYPTANRRDQEINARALPILKQETLTAQSADIDTVSGATVTSDGYIESLQAALDAAHLS